MGKDWDDFKFYKHLDEWIAIAKMRKVKRPAAGMQKHGGCVKKYVKTSSRAVRGGLIPFVSTLECMVTQH